MQLHDVVTIRIVEWHVGPVVMVKTEDYRMLCGDGRYKAARALRRGELIQSSDGLRQVDDKRERSPSTARFEITRSRDVAVYTYIDRPTPSFPITCRNRAEDAMS